MKNILSILLLMALQHNGYAQFSAEDQLSGLYYLEDYTQNDICADVIDIIPDFNYKNIEVREYFYGENANGEIDKMTTELFKNETIENNRYQVVTSITYRTIERTVILKYGIFKKPTQVSHSVFRSFTTFPNVQKLTRIWGVLDSDGKTYYERHCHYTKK